MKIFIDLDDTIVYSAQNFKRQIEEFLGYKVDWDKYGYYLQDALEDRKEEFFNYKPLNMYDGIEIIGNAIEVIKELSVRHEVFIVSDYVLPSGSNQEGNHLKFKLEFLKEHLSFIPSSHIYFMADKTMLPADIMIDDGLRHLKNAKHKLLFTSVHNVNITDSELNDNGVTRVNNWNEVLKYVNLIEGKNKLAEYMNNDIYNPKYLFHGSQYLLDEIRPHQTSCDTLDENNLANAIYLFSSFLKATPFALKNGFIKSLDYNGESFLEVSKKSMEYPYAVIYNRLIDEDAIGYVYVFEKTDDMVKDDGDYQYKCYKPLKPIAIVEICMQDYVDKFLVHYSKNFEINVLARSK